MVLMAVLMMLVVLLVKFVKGDVSQLVDQWMVLLMLISLLLLVIILFPEKLVSEVFSPTSRMVLMKVFGSGFVQGMVKFRHVVPLKAPEVKLYVVEKMIVVRMSIAIRILVQDRGCVSQQCLA